MHIAQDAAEDLRSGPSQESKGAREGVELGHVVGLKRLIGLRLDIDV